MALPGHPLSGLQAAHGPLSGLWGFEAAGVPSTLVIPSPGAGVAGGSAFSPMALNMRLWSVRGANTSMTPMFMRVMPQAVFMQHMGALNRIKGYLDDKALRALANTCTKARHHIYGPLWDHCYRQGNSYLLRAIEAVRQRHFPRIRPDSLVPEASGRIPGLMPALVEAVNNEVILGARQIKFDAGGLSLRRRYQMARIEAGVYDAVHPLNKEGVLETPLSKAALEVLCWGSEMAIKVKTQEFLAACLCLPGASTTKRYVQAVGASCGLLSSFQQITRQTRADELKHYPEWFREYSVLLMPLFYALLVYPQQERQFCTFLATIVDPRAQEFMRVFQHAIKICRVNIEKNQNLLGGWALEGWVLDALFNFKGDVKDIVSIFYSLVEQNADLPIIAQLQEILRRPTIAALNQWLDAHMNRWDGVHEGVIKPFSLLRAFIWCTDKELKSLFYKKLYVLTKPVMDSFHRGLISPAALKKWVIETICSFTGESRQIIPLFEEIVRRNAGLSINMELRDLLREYQRSSWVDREVKMTALKEWLRAHEADLGLDLLMDGFALCLNDELQTALFEQFQPAEDAPEDSVSKLHSEVLAALFSRYIKFHPREEALGAMRSRLPLPGVVPRACIPQIQPFVNVVSEIKAEQIADRQKAYIDDPVIKEQMRNRDYLVVAHTLLKGIKYDPPFERDVLKEVGYFRAKSNEMFPGLPKDEFKRNLAELASRYTHLREELRLRFPSTAIDGKLTAVSLDIIAAQSETSNMEAQRIATLQRLYQAFGDVLEEKIQAMAGVRSLGEAIDVPPSSNEEFLTQLTRVQEWLEDPSRAFLFSSITRLDLHGRGLRFVPPSLLSKLELVTYLDLSENALEVIPEEIKSCTQLQKLRLFGNFITEVPAFVWELPNLKALWMNNCHIHTLQPGSVRAGKLEILDLSRNCLSDFPAGFFDQFPVLTQGSFARNNLRTLPESMGNKAWAHIDLADNSFLRVANIPDAVKNSPNAPLQAAVKVYYQLSNERKYQPQSPLALFYQSVLFRHSEESVREAFRDLDLDDKQVVCLSIWDFWKAWEEPLAQGAVPATREERIAQAEIHLCDDRQLLLDIIQSVVVRAIRRQRPDLQLGLLANYLQILSVVLNAEQPPAEEYFGHLINGRPPEDRRKGQLADKVSEVLSALVDTVMEGDLDLEPVIGVYDFDSIPESW